MLFVTTDIIIFSLSVKFSPIPYVCSYITNAGQERKEHPRVILSYKPQFEWNLNKVFTNQVSPKVWINDANGKGAKRCRYKQTEVFCPNFFFSFGCYWVEQVIMWYLSPEMWFYVTTCWESQGRFSPSSTHFYCINKTKFWKSVDKYLVLVKIKIDLQRYLLLKEPFSIKPCEILRDYFQYSITEIDFLAWF